MRPSACNFLLALLQMEEICSSKLRSESVVTPSKVSLVFVLIGALHIDTLKGVVELKSKYHFPRLALRYYI